MGKCLLALIELSLMLVGTMLVLELQPLQWHTFLGVALIYLAHPITDKIRGKEQ